MRQPRSRPGRRRDPADRAGDIHLAPARRRTPPALRCRPARARAVRRLPGRRTPRRPGPVAPHRPARGAGTAAAVPDDGAAGGHGHDRGRWHRRPARDPGRVAPGPAERLSGDGLRPAGPLGTIVLAGGAADPAVRPPARVAAPDWVCAPRRRRMGEPPPHGPSGPLPGAGPGRSQHAHRAQQPAGSPRTTLRPHGARQGPCRAGGNPAARAAQRPDPGRHRARAPVRDAAGRHGDYRTDIRPAGRWPLRAGGDQSA